jgi:hypothetical protein
MVLVKEDVAARIMGRVAAAAAAVVPATAATAVEAPESVARNVALFFAAPFIGLAYIIAFPFIGVAALVKLAIQARA